MLGLGLGLGLGVEAGGVLDGVGIGLDILAGVLDINVTGASFSKTPPV